VRWWAGLRVSLAVPAWEAYDEPAHFAYVVTLATTGRLPQAPETVQITQAAHTPERIQPPLYYAVMAAALWLSGTEVAQFVYPDRNPYFYFGVGNPNYALHREPPLPRRAEIERALRLSRLLSLLLTLPAAAFVWRAAALVWSPNVSPHGTLNTLNTLNMSDAAGAAGAVGAALLIALWPQALFNGSMVTNDAPMLTLGAATVYALLRLTRLPLTRGRGALVLGLIGVGMLVKLTMLLMLLPFGWLLLGRVPPPQARRWLVVAGVGAVLAMFALSLSASIWLPFREVNQFGEPPWIAVWQTLALSGGRLVPDALGYLAYSSVGLFGWGNVPAPAWVQWPAWGGVGLAAVGAAIGWRRRPRPGGGVLLACVLAQVLGGLALALFAQTIHVLNGRYTFPASGAVAILLVWGWSWLGRRTAALMLATSTAGLLVVSAWLPSFLAATYARPPAVAGAFAQRPARELLPGAVLVGYEISQDLPGANTAGRGVSIALYWAASRRILTDYVLRIELIGADGQGYGLLDSIPGNGTHPTTNWTPGEVFRDVYRVPLRFDAPPGSGHVRVGMVAGRDRASVVLPDAEFIVE
jgi:hypothetical protein